LSFYFHLFIIVSVCWQLVALMPLHIYVCIRWLTDVPR